MSEKTAYDLTPDEWREYLLSLGEPAYRTDQVLHWLYVRLASSFAEMSDLSLALRERLTGTIPSTCLQPLRESISRDGQTHKVLFQFADSHTVEASIMLYGPDEASRERHTVCVSTQVGCAIGCPFCATGRQGFRRNLTSGEIIAQIIYFMRTASRSGPGETLRRPVTNIVFMGMGEPLANYDALYRAVTMLNGPAHVGSRQMTVSTSGMVPQIRRLAEEPVRVELAVSLHAADDILRNRLVPLNRKYPLTELAAALRDYAARTGRRPTIEYALFRGINDSAEQATALVRWLRDLHCSVNLIPGNPVAGAGFYPSSMPVMLSFQEHLRQAGVASTFRVARGQDVEAGCGQLRSRYQEDIRLPADPETAIGPDN